MQRPALRAVVVTTLSLALLTACRGGDAPTPTAPMPDGKTPDRAWTDAARVEALASTLQACSYDGGTVKVDPGKLNGQAPADCRDMVEKIMSHTGLPSNFVVTAGPVPNALAIILLDDQKIPKRFIAFNPDFMADTTHRAGGTQWAPISIMAHEIGHHLSGHTITQGGSRPEIELEADKFSGYVLYKMGAPLAEASRAMSVIASPVEQATHPAKARRLAAISEGWQEACRQAGASDCASGTVAARTTTPPATPVASTNSGVTNPAASSAPQPASGQPTATSTGAMPTPTATNGSTTVVTGDITDGEPMPPPLAPVAPPLPVPTQKSIPFKYGRFVVDETGRLDQRELQALEKQLFELAKSHGVELALLVVNDTHGMTVQDYAWAMLRQLRIGKLDLGNGGVFVLAPEQGTSAVAFAPGVAKQLEFNSAARQMERWAKTFWTEYCLDKDGCARMTTGLTDTVGSPVRMISRSDVRFQIRFNSIEEAVANSIAFEEKRRAARKAGKKVEVGDDEYWPKGGALVRFTGTVTDVAPRPDPPNPESADDMRVNRWLVTKGGWRAVLVETPEGEETTLYLKSSTETLMPAGKLQKGKQYTFVGELKSTGRFHTDEGVVQINPGAYLFSYDPL